MPYQLLHAQGDCSGIWCSVTGYLVPNIARQGRFLNFKVCNVSVTTYHFLFFVLSSALCLPWLAP